MLFINASDQQRQPEPRDSRRVELADIEKNDFNLNTSRSISTAATEAMIELRTLHWERVALEHTPWQDSQSAQRSS